MTDVSELGLDIEDALRAHPKIRIHGAPKKYLQAYITAGGFVFAAERTGKSGVNLWTVPDWRVKAVAEKRGLTVDLDEPFDHPDDPTKYGRHSGIEKVNELAYLSLFKIRVSSPAEALEIVGPLLDRIP